MQKEPPVERMDQFTERCRKFGLKITPQRCAVFNQLLQALEHPTADDVYQGIRRRYPNISYDTVNRTLMTFAEIGLVDIVQTKGGPRRFDPVMDDHHHFHCINCGAIVDFCTQSLEELEIPDHILKNFTIFSKRVVLNGLCEKCRKIKRSQDR
jgi:Fur family peroxide stress response transcriptional regulator